MNYIPVQVKVPYRFGQNLKRRQLNDESLNTATHHRELWDPSDIEGLQQFAGEKIPFEIAVELGRTIDSIEWKAREEKISLATGKREANHENLLMCLKDATVEFDRRRDNGEIVHLVDKGLGRFIVVEADNGVKRIKTTTVRYIKSHGKNSRITRGREVVAYRKEER